MATTRQTSSTRQRQIVEATLELLAEIPVASISTRMIARRVGISQPALFRHYRSREAILIATLDHTRSALGALVQQILTTEKTPVDQLRALFCGLLDHIEKNPGLPRILLADVPAKASAIRTALAHLVSMQRSFAAELIRLAQKEGLLRTDIPREEAAAALIALIQGIIIQGQLRPAPDGADDTEGNRATGDLVRRRAPLLFDIWLRGVAPVAGVSTDLEQPEQPEPPASSDRDGKDATARDHPGIVALDVRPLLARGVDPLDTVVATLEDLGESGVLVLTAPFRPAPLVTLLEGRGYTVTVAAGVDDGTFVVEAIAGGASVADLTDLEAPEPLQRVLEATATLPPGGTYLARLPRFPRLLIGHLEERGLSYTVHEGAGGSALLHVRRCT